MTMKPEISALTQIELAIDADTTQWVKTQRSDVVSIPVWSFANSPEVEDRWLRAEMEHCFQAMRQFINGYNLTFEQEPYVYNRIPLGKTAEDIPQDQLIALIEEARHV